MKFKAIDPAEVAAIAKRAEDLSLGIIDLCEQQNPSGDITLYAALQATAALAAGLVDEKQESDLLEFLLDQLQEMYASNLRTRRKNP